MTVWRSPTWWMLVLFLVFVVGVMVVSIVVEVTRTPGLVTVPT